MFFLELSCLTCDVHDLGEEAGCMSVAEDFDVVGTVYLMSRVSQAAKVKRNGQ